MLLAQGRCHYVSHCFCFEPSLYAIMLIDNRQEYRRRVDSPKPKQYTNGSVNFSCWMRSQFGSLFMDDDHQCDLHRASLIGRADCRLHGTWDIQYGDGKYWQVIPTWLGSPHLFSKIASTYEYRLRGSIYNECVLLPRGCDCPVRVLNKTKAYECDP